MREAIKLVGTAIVILILVLIFGPRFVSAPAPAAPPETAAAAAKKSEIRKRNEAQSEMAAVYELAKKSVREKLKDPSDAKFSSFGWDEEAKIAPYGYHQWLCSGWVDAFNSFGAKGREKWGVCVFKSDTIWRADYIEIGDSVYGQMPDRIAFPKTPEQIAAEAQARAVAKVKDEAAKKANADRALKFNQADADKGDAYGLLRMGERYRDGEGVDKDLNKAREYFTKAQVAGSPEAEAELNKLPKP